MKLKPYMPYRTISYDFFMNFHEKEAVHAVSYDFVRFFMNFHEKEAVHAVSYDFFMKTHEIEFVWPFVRFRTISCEFFMIFHEKKAVRPFRTISCEFFMIFHEKKGRSAISYDFVRIFHDIS